MQSGFIFVFIRQHDYFLPHLVSGYSLELFNMSAIITFSDVATPTKLILYSI